MTTQHDNPSLIDELVLANHILATHGVLDAWGHVSIRHPERPDRYLISGARAPALVSAADIVEVDLESNPVKPGPRLFLERFIHGEVYRARADVAAVVHSHSATMIPFSVTGEPLVPISHMASFLTAGAPPVWDLSRSGVPMVKGMLVADRALGSSLAETLGNSSMALMRGHGNVVVGATLRQAVYRSIYAEVNAQQLALALSFRRPITALSPEEAIEPQRLDDAWEQWRWMVARERR